MGTERWTERGEKEIGTDRWTGGEEIGTYRWTGGGERDRDREMDREMGGHRGEKEGNKLKVINASAIAGIWLSKVHFTDRMNE